MEIGKQGIIIYVSIYIKLDSLKRFDCLDRCLSLCSVVGADMLHPHSLGPS